MTGTNQMEATIVSKVDASKTRRVVLSSSEEVPLQCCSYSKNDDGIPWLYTAAYICEKYRSVNLFQFIYSRYFYYAFRRQYEGV